MYGGNPSATRLVSIRDRRMKKIIFMVYKRRIIELFLLRGIMEAFAGSSVLIDGAIGWRERIDSNSDTRYSRRTRRPRSAR